jgi:hypothetical protein
MFSKTRLLLVVTALTACVLLSCSENAVTPEGQGTADSRAEPWIYGYCYRGSPPPGIFYPAEGVHVWCIYDGDYTDEDGRYDLDMNGADPPEYVTISAQVGNLTPYPSETILYLGGTQRGPDFYFP